MSKRGTQHPIEWRRLYWEIGFRVRIAREARDMTQEMLARRVGLTRVSITNLETGRQRTPIDKLYEIAFALRVRPQTLLPSTAEVRR